MDWELLDDNGGLRTERASVPAGYLYRCIAYTNQWNRTTDENDEHIVSVSITFAPDSSQAGEIPF